MTKKQIKEKGIEKVKEYTELSKECKDAYFERRDGKLFDEAWNYMEKADDALALIHEIGLINDKEYNYLYWELIRY